MEMQEGTYDTSQVCLNGHKVTDMYDSHPEFRKKHCSECGAPTITACPACGERMTGYLHGGGAAFGMYPPPAFCHNCGKPFPWTEAGLAAARELTDEVEGLSVDEREQLKRSLDDLVADTPRTGLAVVRFKKLATKGGQAVAQGLKQILISVVTEAARKQIWPS